MPPSIKLARMRGVRLDSPHSKEEEMNVPIWVWVLVGIILVIVIFRMV
jgi:hypothetical protein